jgi:hypothetical protein
MMIGYLSRGNGGSNPSSDPRANKQEVTMGREVRMVPADWEHPVDATGKYIPLYRGY